MDDLEKAKKILKDRDLSLVIVKDGAAIFCSDSSGVHGILQAIRKLDGRLSGASVADKVVGKAAALLFAYAHVLQIYAVILSEKGLSVLRRNNISVEYDLLVPEILDLSDEDITLRLEMLVRAYDPCISCSTHYLDVKFV